jgi:opacity protein-like surface antigen
MTTRTSNALALIAVGALADPARADDVAQETGAVTIAPEESAAAPANAPPAPRPTRPGKLRILAGLHFGFGGHLDIDAETPLGIVTSRDPDLDPSVGLQAGVDYLLIDYFALGGELRLSWWKPENNIGIGEDPDRSLFVDIDVKPRGFYRFSGFPLEVYGTMPLGLSFASINDDIPMDGGAGFNLGFGAGANYFFTSHLGVNMELLGVWHWFDGEVDLGNADTDNRTAQFYWVLNAVFAI